MAAQASPAQAGLAPANEGRALESSEPPTSSASVAPSQLAPLGRDAPASRAQLRPPSAAFPGTSLSLAAISSALGNAPLHDLHAVGSTSTVFRSRLGGAAFRAAFKTATRDRPRGPIAEVAAYRLGRCLGLQSIPPAVLRRVPKRTLRAELDPATAERWPSIEPRLLVDRAGTVDGAAILWIDGLRDAGVAGGTGRANALRALGARGPLPPLAAALSGLLVFDALIGNWDRWSGANVQTDASARALYIRDNDAGFAPRLPAVREASIFALLRRCQRFSRRTITALRALTRESFEHALSQDPGLAADPTRSAELGAAGVFERRERVLQHVQALIDAHGEAAVLSLP
jgi:hypothetical protein